MEWDTGSNVFIRPNILGKNQVINGHKHAFNHTSIVLAGAVKVRIIYPNTHISDKERAYIEDFHDKLGIKWEPPPAENVVEQIFKAPAHFLVNAGIEHEIIGLEDRNVFWCVYAHRNPQGEVVEKNIGWGAAYS